MPRATPSLALLLAAASLAGCGGHGYAGRRGSTAAGASARGSLTFARARAYARAVNLTATDVPGFSAAARAAPPRRKRAEGELFRCAGARGSASRGRRASDLAHESSPSFELHRGIVDLGVSSEVGVARTAGLADAELAALHSGRVRTCFERYLDAVLAAGRPRGSRVGPVTIESGNPPAPGTSGSFGWRMRASFGVRGLRIPVYLDMLGFVYGPSRVTLVSSGALRPFPAFAQQRLFALLLARAHEHGI